MKYYFVLLIILLAASVSGITLLGGQGGSVTKIVVNQSGGGVGGGESNPVIGDMDAEPVCDETIRGTLYISKGTPGISDWMMMCIKNDLDTYEWKEVPWI